MSTTIAAPAVAEVAFLGACARLLGDGLVDLRDVPAGDMPPLHVHHHEDEGFYVLEGEVTLFVPGGEVTLRPGERYVAPRGVPHTYRVGATPARWLVSAAPGGFETFVAAVGALEAQEPAAVGALAAASGIEILGAPGMLPEA